MTIGDDDEVPAGAADHSTGMADGMLDVFVEDEVRSSRARRTETQRGLAGRT